MTSRIMQSEAYALVGHLADDAALPLDDAVRARVLAGAKISVRDYLSALREREELKQDFAAALSITAHKAARWRNRFLDVGLAGLEKDAPRAGRTPSISAARVKRVIHKTTQEKPANATHWSTRTMAAAVDLSAATVRRIWRNGRACPWPTTRFVSPGVGRSV